MPRKGRPRLTQEALKGRIAAYCDQYGVRPNAEGLPPFPSGKRETRQHRDWVAVYKAHNRLLRRARGQCERCSAPAGNGSVFCDRHRAEVSARAGGNAMSVEARGLLLEAQGGRCPICGLKIELRDAVDHTGAAGGPRGVLHPRCHRLVGLAEEAGTDTVNRLRAYLWPGGSGKTRRGRATG